MVIIVLLHEHYAFHNCYLKDNEIRQELCRSL